MYNLGDQTWRNQPAVMPREVVHSLMQRVRTHCERHGMDRFALILHGGEPLLAGEDFLVDFVTEARRVLEPKVALLFKMQTNGTLLTPALFRLLQQLQVRVGISLDGPEPINDRHRLDHAGRSSYGAVMAGIDSARQVDPGYAPTMLSVIDLDNDPIQAYEHFLTVGAREVDFLLPDATHDRPPPPGPARSEAPYADWLIRIFDRWFFESPRAIGVRLFEEIITVLCGMPNYLDQLGVGRNEVLVVETDGGLEAVDSLKVCGDGFTKMKANVLTHELDEALATDLARTYHMSGERACATCQACSLHRVCGGGYLPHRYSSERGFDNVSVYCQDLMKLIVHIQNRLCEQLPQSMLSRAGLAPLVYEALRSRLPRPPRRRSSLPVLSAAG
jgi:uncharacterized protein